MRIAFGEAAAYEVWPHKPVLQPRKHTANAVADGCALESG